MKLLRMASPSKRKTNTSSSISLSVSVHGGKSHYDFSEQDIQELLDEVSYGDQIFNADNIPKWCYMAMFMSSSIKTIRQARPLVTQILDAALEGKLKKIDFEYDPKGDIIGFKTPMFNTKTHKFKI